MADNLLDKASILLTPTAYDNGSMLSIKPENGDGDFDFERNSAATRVNAQGLIENVQIINSELVSNGNFSQIGTEEVLNGNFSQEGSELVTNGDFATDSDWTKNDWNISGGTLNGSASTGIVFQSNLGIVVGKTYKVVLEISNYTSGSIRFKVGGASYQNIASEDGVQEFYFVAATTANNILFSVQSAYTGSIDNVSVKEVGQNWTLGSGWSIGDDKAICDGTNIAYLTQTSVLSTGTSYKVQFDIVDYTSGSVKYRDNGLVSGQSFSGVGSYTDYVVAGGGQFRLMSENFIGSITNISVKEVGQDWSIIDSDADNYVEFNQTQGTARLKFLNTSPLTKLQSTAQYISGKKYKLIVDVAEVVSGGIKIDAAGVSQTYNSVGIQEAIIEPTGTQFIAFYRATADVDITLNSISVKEITDDTNIPRINYEGFSYQDTLGSEEIVNGDFATDSNWNKGNGWSISDGKANSDGTNNYDQLRQTSILTIGKSYKLIFDLTYVSGLVKFTTPSVDSEYNSSGTYTLNFIADSANVVFTAWGAFTGSIDNVSVKEVTGQEVVPDSGCGSWLLEPQSTNLVQQSNNVLDYGQNTADVTLSTNLSPEGVKNCWRVQGTQSGLRVGIATFSPVIGQTYTGSVYVRKVSGSDTATIVDIDNTSQTINITTEWQRFSITKTADSNIGRVYVLLNNIGDVIEVYGFQLEEQSYATSYIPTNGATNTRLQDIANNSGNSSLINSTEGVLYAEIASLADDGTNRGIALSDGTTSNRVNILFGTGSNKIRTIVKSNSSTSFDEEYTVTSTLNYHKIAIKYKENDFALWIDGIERFTDTSGSSPIGLSKLAFNIGSVGNLNFFGKVKAVAVFPILTDAELQSLTSN